MLQLAAVAAVVLAGSLLPGTRFALLIATNWITVGLVLVGIRRHRPSRAHPWWAVLAFVALVAAGNTCVAWLGPNGAAVVAATTAGQLAAAATVPRLVGRVNVAGASAGRVLDGAVLVIVFSVAATELAASGVERHFRSGFSWALVAAPVVDVVVMAVLLWIVLSRTRLMPAVVLVLCGGFGCLTYDVLVTTAGQRVATPGDATQVLAAANMLLFGLAALQPSMTRVGKAVAAAQPRRSFVQFLMVLPCALAPAALLAAGTAGRQVPVPLPVLAAVTLLVMGAMFLRALLALRVTEHAAEIDPLTGLLNRAGLARAYAAALMDEPTSATHDRWLLMIDLDDFKGVNDRHGHLHGDDLLRAVGDRLRSSVPQAAAIARHGGDEFIVLTHGAVTSGRAGPGEAVLDGLSQPLLVGGQQLVVTASVGAAALLPGHDLARTLADADIAMYSAKRAGKGRTATFNADLRRQVLRRLATIDDLRALLAGDRAGEAGELRLLYQPIVDLSDGAVVGAEALARWSHPQRGLIGPDEFLPLVEQEGLGVQFDLAVLRMALQQLGEWNHGALQRLTLSLNLGLSSMCDPDLARWVAAAVAQAGASPARLRFEITEHDQLPADPTITAAIAELTHAGFGISLDDFGSGYTSLVYLRRFPIGLLKLDRSLLDQGDDADQPLITGIAALGRSLGLELLAEGIETAQQHDALRRAGIRYGQGYHLGRPMTASELTAFVSTRVKGVP